MKTPKFTDKHRFPRPYRASFDTDIRRSHGVEERRLKKQTEAKGKTNVRDLSEVFHKAKRG